MTHQRHFMAGRLALGGALSALLLAGAGHAADGAAGPPALLVVAPVKLAPHPQGAMMPNGTGCAVDIDDGQRPAQRVITVGAGQTETLSCVRFVAAGPLPSPRSIGLIYDLESGPGSTFRAAVIMTQDEETGLWSMNEDRTDLIVNGDIADLDSLRAALSAR